MEKIATQEAHNKKTIAIFATGLGLAALVVALTVAGHAPRMISGEALYDFMYPDRFPFFESVFRFLTERVQARVFHGILIAVIYKIMGFNPVGIYLLIQFAIIGTAVVIALIIKEFIKTPIYAALVTLSLSVFPLLIPELFSLKKIHHVAAWFFFWLCILMFQFWVEKKKIGFLLFSSLLFVISVLSYEATFFLLPVALLVCWKHIGGDRNKSRYFLSVVLTMMVASGFYLIASTLLGGGRGPDVANFRDIYGLLFSILTSPIEMAKVIFENGLINSNRWGGFDIFSVAGLVILLSIAIVISLLIYAKAKNQFKDSIVQNAAVLVLVFLWLTFATYLPFALLGQSPDADSLLGAGYGVVLIILAAATLLDRFPVIPFGGAFSVLCCLVYVGTGAILYGENLEAKQVSDAELARTVFTLKEAVPFVKENSTFIFVNSGVGRTGCIGFVNMLYTRENLSCIHLFDSDTEETYTHVDGQLIEDTGRIFEPDFIILEIQQDGGIALLDQITSGDYPDLPITWIDTEAIVTNRDRILMRSNVTSQSRLYNYVIEAFGSEP